MENLSEEFLLFWKETPEEEEEDNREQEEEEDNREEKQKKISALWKRSEMKICMEAFLLIKRKKMVELEEKYYKQRMLKEAGEKGVKVHNKLMAYYRKYAPDYLQFRDDWIARNPAGLQFEDITRVLAMYYSNSSMPRYVYDGHSDSLQIYDIRVSVGNSPADLQWPLQVFGVIAVRDSIDSMRNILFNRDRDDCQTLTEEDSYLALTGPSRAVGMNEPVTIEAELKVKGSAKSKDRYFILEAKTIPLDWDISTIGLTGARGSHLLIALGGLRTCVEATIFFRVIDGTWPAGLQGSFVASTANSPMSLKLVAFGGDGESTIRDDGNMTHLRHAVSVEESGQLIVKVHGSIGGQASVAREVRFGAKLSGRSFGSLEVLSCRVGVLVAWSRIRPMCDDLVSGELRRLCLP